MPRTADGSVDVHATTQLLNDVVERWVREDPGQWMWFHKRWEISKWRRKKRPKPAPVPSILNPGNHVRQMVQYISPALGMTSDNCLRRQTLVG